MKKRLISLTLTLAALLASGALAHANTTGLPGPGATPATNPPIAWADLGANATVQYSGDGLAVASTADGAVRLRCAFQKLEGEVTREGLWLNSTVPGAASRFRLVAAGLGRAGGATVALPENGVVAQDKQMARFTRPGLTEEYSVSVDGVRQDFVVAAPPGGTGDLRVELAVDGATVEALPGPDQPNAGSVGRVPSRGADGTEAGDAGSGDPAYTESVGRVPSRGARLTLDGSGRKLAYSRLRVTDATGKELAARMEVTPKSEIRNPKWLWPWWWRTPARCIPCALTRRSATPVGRPWVWG